MNYNYTNGMATQRAKCFSAKNNPIARIFVIAMLLMFGCLTSNGVTTFEWTKKLRDLSINFKS